MGEQDLFCGDNPRKIERHIIDFIVSLKEKGLGIQRFIIILCQ